MEPLNNQKEDTQEVVEIHTVQTRRTTNLDRENMVQEEDWKANKSGDKPKGRVEEKIIKALS